MHRDSLTVRQRQSIDMACELASRSEVERFKHGCVIYKRGVLGAGCNQEKTHPLAKETYTQRIHAELAAILSANGADLSGADMFVARMMRVKDAPVGMSKPCPVCMKFIKNAGIRRVFYTTGKTQTDIEVINL